MPVAVFPSQPPLDVVGSLLVPTYNLRQFVSNTVTFSDMTANAVAAPDLTLVYRTRLPVASTLTPRYSLIQHIGTSLSLSYMVCLWEQVSVSKNITYRIHNVCQDENLKFWFWVYDTVEWSTAFEYAVHSLSGSTVLPLYDLQEAMDSLLVPAYEVTAPVLKEFAPVFVVRNMAQGDLTLVYNAENMAHSLLVPVYGMAPGNLINIASRARRREGDATMGFARRH